MKYMYELNEMGVALLKINNPPLNAIDDQVLEELESAAESIASDNRVKVAVVTGDGAALVAGADIKKMQKFNTTTQAEEITSKAHAILSRRENSRKPYIAAIYGLCLVGGIELALACHMRIADDGVTMGLPRDLFRDSSLDSAGSEVRDYWGLRGSFKIMLVGKFIDMTEADKIGLVNKVVP